MRWFWIYILTSDFLSSMLKYLGMWLVSYVTWTSLYVSTMPTNFYRTSWSLGFIYSSSLWRPKRVISSQFLRNATPGLPGWLALHLQKFDSMCRTMKPFSNFPHTYCCSCCSFYHCCCFNFFCSCFNHFRLTPMWVFGPSYCSWFVSIFSFTWTYSCKRKKYAYSIFLARIASVGGANGGKSWTSCLYSA